MGTTMDLNVIGGDSAPFRVVGKLYGHGVPRPLIGIVVEDVEQGGRQTLAWPLLSTEEEM